MVGEMRDVETAQIGIQSSLTGHLVLSTVHTNSAVAAIARLRDMGIESYLLASSLKTIIAQRLVRRLCNNCKTVDTPDDETLKNLNLEKGAVVYKAKGCEECLDSGYKGRIAIAECLQVDKKIKEMIHNNSAESEIQDYAFKNNESIDQASTNLILSGITSCDEILRINNLKDNGSV
jgi:general secretion pathway protein E